MFSVCGFNGFQQLQSLLKFLSSSKVSNDEKNNIKKLDISKLGISVTKFLFIETERTSSLKSTLLLSWSYCLINLENTLSVHGFFYGNDGTSIQHLKPPDNLKIIQASCNRSQIICVTEEGGCWQYSIDTGQWKDLSAILCTQLENENTTEVNVVKVCCGEVITAVLTESGEVFNMPNKLVTVGLKIVDVVCGRSHILMLSDRGEVYTAGEGSRGQLGHGELEGEEEPRLVDGLAGLTVTAVAAGGWHSCAITAEGDLYTWGWNIAGQLGLLCQDQSAKVSVQAVPLVVDWPNNLEVRVSKVACGARHTLALLDDGSVWGCGWNGYGQLALPVEESVNCMTKLPTPHDRVQDIICGPWNSCLVT